MIANKAVIIQKTDERNGKMLGMSWPKKSENWEKYECDNFIKTVTDRLIEDGFENIELDRKELLTGRIQVL